MRVMILLSLLQGFINAYKSEPIFDETSESTTPKDYSYVVEELPNDRAYHGLSRTKHKYVIHQIPNNKQSSDDAEKDDIYTNHSHRDYNCENPLIHCRNIHESSDHNILTHQDHNTLIHPDHNILTNPDHSMNIHQDHNILAHPGHVYHNNQQIAAADTIIHDYTETKEYINNPQREFIIDVSELDRHQTKSPPYPILEESDLIKKDKGVNDQNDTKKKECKKKGSKKYVKNSASSLNIMTSIVLMMLFLLN